MHKITHEGVNITVHSQYYRCPPSPQSKQAEDKLKHAIDAFND